MSQRFKSFFRRMSKDHGSGSSSSSQSGSSNHKTTDAPNQGSTSAATPSSKSNKKTSVTSGGDMQTLATVKEEKKNTKTTKSTNRKMSASATANKDVVPTSTSVNSIPVTIPPDRGGTNVTTSTKGSSSTDESGRHGNAMGTPPSATTTGASVFYDNTPSDNTPSASSSATLMVEKQNLEKVVSDLVKNAETKKQEIAALKMEINRLKVSTC